MEYCIQCGTEQDSGAGETCADCGGSLIHTHGGDGTLTGRVLADKYVLLGQLGEGGMGSVYRAKHTALGSMVAIKVLRSAVADQPAALTRFNHEAKNSSQLKHPHNVRVFDFGHTRDGLFYIVMELVDGVPLSELALPLATKRAMRIMLQICGAIAEAHSLGLIHRDLKPDNIMVSAVDHQDFARVLDYGIAKFERSTSNALTADGAMIGTPWYISPEQVDGKHIDRRCDVYLLGLILYELLTGRTPFEAHHSAVMAYKHLSTPPPPPSDFTPIDPELEALILKCLAKDPDERVQTVEALSDALKDVLDGAPIGARGQDTAKSPWWKVGRTPSAAPRRRTPVSQARTRTRASGEVVRSPSADSPPRHERPEGARRGLRATMMGLGIAALLGAGAIAVISSSGGSGPATPDPEVVAANQPEAQEVDGPEEIGGMEPSPAAAPDAGETALGAIDEPDASEADSMSAAPDAAAVAMATNPDADPTPDMVPAADKPDSSTDASLALALQPALAEPEAQATVEPVPASPPPEDPQMIDDEPSPENASLGDSEPAQEAPEPDRQRRRSRRERTTEAERSPQVEPTTASIAEDGEEDDRDESEDDDGVIADDSDSAPDGQPEAPELTEELRSQTDRLLSR